MFYDICMLYVIWYIIEDRSSMNGLTWNHKTTRIYRPLWHLGKWVFKSRYEGYLYYRSPFSDQLIWFWVCYDIQHRNCRLLFELRFGKHHNSSLSTSHCFTYPLFQLPSREKQLLDIIRTAWASLRYKMDLNVVGIKETTTLEPQETRQAISGTTLSNVDSLDLGTAGCF